MKKGRSVVLGIDHSLQGAQIPKDKNCDNPSYEMLIKNLITNFSINYIFEEASGLGPTTAEKMKRPGLEYLDVDPPKPEREAWGIPRSPLPSENLEIYEEDDPRKKGSGSYATQKTAATEFAREKVWIVRMIKKDFTNALVICGAAHTFSVAQRLEALGYPVDVIIYLPFEKIGQVPARKRSNLL